jgi:hypothetical protein
LCLIFEEVKIMHEQVPFETLDGTWTEVDEGLLGVLECLKKLGVHTKFSCQGAPVQKAYISADRQSFKLFEQRLRRAYFSGKLSRQTRDMIKKLIRPGTLVEVAFYTGGGVYQRFRMVYYTKRWNHPVVIRELSYDNEWGARETLRWNSRYTLLIQKALEEVSQENPAL